MKKFLSKRWHGIPVGLVAILLGLSLIGSGVAGAIGSFTFLSFSTVITLDEPLTVDYNLLGQHGGDSNWYPLGDQDSLTLDISPGDVFTMRLRVDNYSDNALVVDTVITGQKGWFTFAGWPNSSSCSNGYTFFDVTVTASGSAPPGAYTVNFAFDRS